MSEQPKRVGELNGPWSVLFKVTNVVVPIGCLLFSILVVSVVIPWVSSTNEKLRQFELNQRSVMEWKAQRPVFVTTAELEAARTKVALELDGKFTEKLNRIETALMRIETLFSEHVKLKP
jgi:hypothetical protein